MVTAISYENNLKQKLGNGGTMPALKIETRIPLIGIPKCFHDEASFGYSRQLCKTGNEFNRWASKVI